MDQSLVEGQWSFVMLAGSLLAMRGLRTGHRVLGGVGLAALALKPPLLIPVFVVLYGGPLSRTAVRVRMSAPAVAEPRRGAITDPCDPSLLRLAGGEVRPRG